MRRLFFTMSLTVVCCLCIAACARTPRDRMEGRIPAAETLYVAAFTQPLGTSELIAGAIPEKQGRVPADMLPALDRNLRNVLAGEGKRSYRWLSPLAKALGAGRFHTSEQPQALSHWVEYGRKCGARFLLIPQVLDWREREGSEAGVTRAAHVRVEFFLLDVQNGVLTGRSVHEEEQVGLVDDLLSVGSFIRRHGTWVTADALAGDGMRKAVRELGL